MNLTQNIQMQIKKVLQFKDMTQKELSTRLDISEAAVSQLLSTDENLSLERIERIAEALDEVIDLRLSSSSLADHSWLVRADTRTKAHGFRVHDDGFVSLRSVCGGARRQAGDDWLPSFDLTFHCRECGRLIASRKR